MKFAVIVVAKMTQQEKEEKQTNRERKTLGSLCSTTGLLLSVMCCIALIHVELRIKEHHRLISHSVTCCDQTNTEANRKVQQYYGRWQDMKGSHPGGHSRETRGTFLTFISILAFDFSISLRHLTKPWYFCLLRSFSYYSKNFSPEIRAFKLHLKRNTKAEIGGYQPTQALIFA